MSLQQLILLVTNTNSKYYCTSLPKYFGYYRLLFDKAQPLVKPYTIENPHILRRIIAFSDETAYFLDVCWNIACIIPIQIKNPLQMVDNIQVITRYLTLTIKNLSLHYEIINEISFKLFVYSQSEITLPLYSKKRQQCTSSCVGTQYTNTYVEYTRSLQFNNLFELIEVPKPIGSLLGSSATFGSFAFNPQPSQVQPQPSQPQAGTFNFSQNQPSTSQTPSPNQNPLGFNFLQPQSQPAQSQPAQSQQPPSSGFNLFGFPSNQPQNQPTQSPNTFGFNFSQPQQPQPSQSNGFNFSPSSFVQPSTPAFGTSQNNQGNTYSSVYGNILGKAKT